MPDFRPATNNEYDLLMYIFNHDRTNFYLRDALYEEHQVFKVTYGDCRPGDAEQPLPAVS